MGLQMTVVDNDSDVSFPNAYIRIATIEDNRIIPYTNIYYWIYKSYEDRLANKSPIPGIGSKQVMVSADVYPTYFDVNILNENMKNPINQAYEFLKTLEYFSTAIDI
jgi:hypothetical protein